MNPFKVKTDSKFKINYINKISINTDNIYYNNIEKIIKKLAYFKPVIDIKSNKDSPFTIPNIYIKKFIEELQVPFTTIIDDLNFLFNNLLEINNQELEKNINLIIKVEKKIKYINDSFTKIINIQSGQIKLNTFEPFSLNFIFLNLESLLANDLYEKNINFKYNIDQDVSDWFLGDIYNIIYILSTITKNAIKYSKLNASILINISSTDIGINKKIITIKIYDNNDLIINKIKNNLFNSPSSLYICKSILELHDGTIQHDYFNTVRGNVFIININLETFNINNEHSNNNIVNNTLTRSLKSINFSKNGMQNNYNILMIHNDENEKLRLYKIFKSNKNSNNIYSFRNGLDAICNIYNNLESINLIIINIELFNPEVMNINGLVICKLLRSMNYNKLIIGLCDNDISIFITDSNFDYIFDNPFTRENINMLFDFINEYGIFIQLNKKIQLFDNKLIWIHN
jgi:hypothetical protein